MLGAPHFSEGRDDLGYEAAWLGCEGMRAPAHLPITHPSISPQELSP